MEDNEFISFSSVQDDDVEDEMEEEEEQNEDESGADYNIEDILKKAAITVKRQLDKLELETGKISFGSDGKASVTDAAADSPAQKKKGHDMHLSSGYEKKRLFLKDVRREQEDGTKKEGLPSAVELKGDKSLRREVKKQRKTRGYGWTYMRAPRLTLARKLEYKVIMLRSQLDPTRRYKRMSDQIPKVFQIGRVVAGAGEFYSGRMTRKETKNTLVDELLADHQARSRAKRKYAEIEKDRNSGRSNFVKARKEARMPRWKKNL